MTLNRNEAKALIEQRIECVVEKGKKNDLPFRDIIETLKKTDLAPFQKMPKPKSVDTLIDGNNMTVTLEFPLFERVNDWEEVK